MTDKNEDQKIENELIREHNLKVNKQQQDHERALASYFVFGIVLIVFFMTTCSVLGGKFVQ